MSIIEKFYKKTIRYDIVNKFSIKNINCLPKIKKVILKCNFRKPKLDNLISTLLGLELITSKKCKISYSKKTNLLLKIKKGDPIECYIIIKSKKMFDILFFIFYDIIPKLNNFDFPLNKNNNNIFNITIKDPFIIKEIENNYNYFKKFNYFSINIITSKNTFESRFLIKSLLNSTTM